MAAADPTQASADQITDPTQVEVAGVTLVRPIVEEVRPEVAEIVDTAVGTVTEQAVGGVRVSGLTVGRADLNAFVVYVNVTFAGDSDRTGIVRLRVDGEILDGDIRVTPGGTRSYQLSGATLDAIDVEVLADDGTVLAGATVPAASNGATGDVFEDRSVVVVVGALFLLGVLILLGLRAIYGTPRVVVGRLPWLMGRHRRTDEHPLDRKR